MQRLVGNDAVARIFDRPEHRAERGSGAGIAVARMMSVAAFNDQIQQHRRGKKILPVQQALAEYHALSVEDYEGRSAKLELLQRTITTYLERSKTKEHREAVEQLSSEAGREPALKLGKLLRMARRHEAVYRRLLEVKARPDAVEQVRLLQRAHDEVLALTSAEQDDDLGLIGVGVLDWITQIAGKMITTGNAAQQHRLGEGDVDKLAEMAADDAVPDVTRNILRELLANRGIIDYRSGTPGTTLSSDPEGRKYTLKNLAGQPLGTPERLGSLAHELTHVSAGEAYENTPVLLLLRRNLGDDEIRDVVRQRSEVLDRLNALVDAHPGLDPQRVETIKWKLSYGGSGGKVETYAQNYLRAGKIDQPTYDALLRYENLAAPRSGVLVEFDTVLNQLLVWFHLWGIDQRSELYGFTLRAAERQRRERRG
ncbi:hypothetical protein ACL03H_06160 [Saccharopolyspora sp. MS10]|uniref:hypothetical protein n=1 Tax=Saccharopolyspora sp. MS10 TaxID=3385973 RepID=UPI0039A345C6